MQREVIDTPEVPPARVPLSQAIKAGDWIFASGQFGNDPRTGKLAEGGIAAQTRRVCEHLKAIFETEARRSRTSSRSRSTWSTSPSCRR
jgi:2-iminobutanoate/2-iminopropanoate deaminase